MNPVSRLMRCPPVWAAVPLLLTGRAAAEPAALATKPMSLEDCIQTALEHNLDIKIRRYDPEIADYNVSISYSGYDPNFTFSANQNFTSQAASFNTTIGLPIPGITSKFQNFNSGFSGLMPFGLNYTVSGNLGNSFNSLSGLQYNGGASITLAQPLLKNFWVDSTRLQIALAKKQLKVSEQTLRQQVMVTVTQVEQAYYNLTFARESIRVQEKALQLAQQLLAENKKRVEVGAMAPLDEKQAESQAATAQAGLLAARQAWRTQENALKTLLSDNYGEWQSVAIEPNENLIAVPQTFDRNESWQKGLTQRPELLQMKLNLEKADLTIRYDFNQLFPSLTINGRYGRNGGVTIPATGYGYGDVLNQFLEEANPSYGYGATLSFPLSNRGPRYQYRIDKANRKQMLLQLQQLTQNVMVQIDNDLTKAQSDFERVDATHQARLYAEAALEAEQKKLENGKSTSFVVLQLQSNLTSARSDEIRALADYNNDLAQLALDEGSALARAHVQLQVK